MAVNLNGLIQEGEAIIKQSFWDDLGMFQYVNNDPFDEWKRKALMFVQGRYAGHPQVDTLEKHVQADNQAAHCRAIISILKAFDELNPKAGYVDYDQVLLNIFNRFNTVARQLQRRHDGRGTLVIKDEYDVQDLLHALLLMHFCDVRPEEWTPSYAGGSKRMDFLLKESEIAIEVKMTRKGLGDKELGEQLIIDITNYKQHKGCKCLFCFVYDPEGIIRNPRGIENDLMALDKDYPVKVFIRPVY